MTITTTLTSAPDLPDRTEQDQTVFDTRMAAWWEYMKDDFEPELNDIIDEINSATSEVTSAEAGAEAAQLAAEDAEANAEVSQNLAQAAANYVGAWSSQTGSASTGISVSHAGVFWALNTDLADITASEPSATNTDWSEIAVSLFTNATALKQAQAIALYF